MSDIIDISGTIKRRNVPVCRVAYTLNNKQPVACTIIGSQPFFYMDYTCEDEDADLLLDEGDLGILAGEVQALQKEMESLNRISADYRTSSEERFQTLLENADSISGFSAAFQAGSAPLESLLQILRSSRITAAYLESAAQHGVNIVLSGDTDTAEYHRDQGFILINQHLDTGDQVLLALRELRRHWQHRQGVLINPLTFHPDSSIVMNRALAADLAAAMVRGAWELQLAGHKAAWERIENSSMADLGRAFAREAFADFRTLNSGMAATAVFEAWFLSERPRSEDKRLIRLMLADYKGYVFDLGQAGNAVTPSFLSALGETPNGKNYLAPHVNTILSDTIFTEVRDRSNANFLWFIKFERSFRETEQELQTSPVSSAKDVRPTAHQTQDTDHDHAATRPAESADIISLFPAATDCEGAQKNGDKQASARRILRPKGDSKRRKSKGSADIVYLRRWSGE